MTHYDIDYSNLDDVTKHNKAIQDIKNYLGNERFKELTRKFKQEQDITLERFGLYCDIAGVRGLPVKAWYNYIYGL